MRLGLKKEDVRVEVGSGGGRRRNAAEVDVRVETRGERGSEKDGFVGHLELGIAT